MNKKDWLDLLRNAPETIIQETITYYKNKKLNWHQKLISLSREDIDDLVAFQQALFEIRPEEKV